MEHDAEWPENIVAERHEVSGKWVLQYLTDEQAKKCQKALWLFEKRWDKAFLKT